MYEKMNEFASVVVASKAKVYRKTINGKERVVMEYKGYVRRSDKPETIQEIRLVENESAAIEKAKIYKKGLKVAVRMTGWYGWENPLSHKCVCTWYGYGMKK